MTDARVTSNSIEIQYLELLWELQARRWEIYANGAELDLTDISTALQALSQSAMQTHFSHTARDRVLSQIMQRIRVDHHPEVSSLSNRLADWSTHLRLPDTITPAWRRDLSEAMEPDVIELLKKRNSLAEELGFSSYGHLVADTEGFDLDAMTSFAMEQRVEHLPVASRAAAKEGVSVATWFSWLDDFAKVVASHDRYFLDRVCSDIFSIEPDGSVLHHPGGWSAYRKQALHAAEQPGSSTSDGGPQRQKQKRTKLTYNDQRDLNELTRRIPQLEKEEIRLTDLLDTSEGNYERTVELADKLAETITDLDTAETRWLELTERAEQLSAGHSSES